MVSIVIILTTRGKADLLFGGFFWNRSALQLLMDLDIFAHFFFGFGIFFAHTLGLASGVGNCD